MQLTAGATEAKSSMFKLATDVSSWWANLDPGVPKPSQPAASSATRSASDAQQVLSCSFWCTAVCLQSVYIVQSAHTQLVLTYDEALDKGSVGASQHFWVP